MKSTILALACFLLHAGLGANAKSSLDYNVDDLCQHWVHSFEEQQKGETREIYRPAGSRTFSPSRFRMEYIFEKNGNCKWYFLSPDDDHRFKNGKWKINAIDKNLLMITKDGKTESFKIEELSKSVLRFTLLNPK